MDSNKKPAPKRRRARNSDGSFKGDIPGTKLNEAWIADDISEEVGEKTVDYSVKKLIDTSSPTAGKYGRKDAIRPTFGKVRTTNY